LIGVGLSLWMNDYLNEAGGVPKIEKDHSPVVAASVYPPGEANFPTDVFGTQLATEV
jgi:hypothetical protein